MDLATLTAMRKRASEIVAYQRRPRPVQPDSFPPFVDAELRRIDSNSRDVAQVLQDLNARLTALGG